MKQMIVRVDDELHSQLKARAAAEGRSLNDLMTAALAAVVEVGTTRRTLRARARLARRLVVPEAPRRVPSRRSALTATTGLGRAASEALRAERDDR
jgi:antitoxin FitA